MIKRCATQWLLLGGLILPSLAFAESAIDRLNNFVKQVSQLEADFQQTVIDTDGQVVEEATGQFLLSRPGKFRWDYDTPFPQQIVADGERIWFYDVDLEQITVKLQDEALAETPAGLLSGNTLPEAEYNIVELESEDELQWVRLMPKENDNTYQTVALAFDANGIREMLMVDSFDQRTRLVFNNVRINAGLPDSRFKFITPEGVDVVGDIP
ncbi:outer membrane lipoprotein chaperone LolA [Methylophaga sp.]|uniref:outer membrane lipoprotein chaperone LolA n=1 Tax=Methylophaga sp. TaxID=2024840 RepID=UPI002718119D|nr:outer membrane lipoprotein chaperone LolA [Methylophaga sp.]MDO8828398.1 outer membrane lipoprotein chaperone LolA [Methylophaga sp.]